MITHIQPLDLDTAPAEARAAAAGHATHGRITNMKQTLLHSVPAFHAYMEWYTQYDRLLPLFGERAVWLFCHAISSGTDCLICSTFFRRLLLDAGIKPGEYVANEKEALLSAFGRQFLTAQGEGKSGPVLWAKLNAAHPPAVLVDLVAFGGLMVATNLFNNMVGVQLDEYLEDYRKPQRHEPAPTI
ncbi:hypothetical protein ACQW02_13055 [Humitalea sp. 24SJ18S-53]|uniref:hypothetical protein n=1 Tax=Humitalea sp. 24SJ18S-53 TaxID=3422307 RepID=UPI003D67FBDC